MPIEVICPGCQRRFVAHESWSGKAVSCPQCQQMVATAASVPPALPSGFPVSGVIPPEPTIPAPRSASTPRARQHGSPGFLLPLLITLGAGGVLLVVVVLLSTMNRSTDRVTSKQIAPQRKPGPPSSAAASAAPPGFAKTPVAPSPPSEPVDSRPKEAASPQAETVSTPANRPATPLVNRPISPFDRSDPPTRPSVPRSPPLPPRAYEQGPLGPPDYGIDPPEDRQGLAAYTYVGIRYRYLARSMSTRKGVKITATSVTVYAEVDPARSWNLALENSRLLAHEQLHFDIAHLYAVRWRRVLQARIAKQRLTAFAKDQAAAAAELDAALERDFLGVKDAMFKFQQQYDDETSRGRDYARQDQWQERIRQELAELE